MNAYRRPWALLAAALLVAVGCGAPGVPPEEIGETSQAIVGGSLAGLGEYPWQALIQRVGVNGPWCGGSLLNDRWVLTAAYCVAINGVRPGDFTITLGAHTRSFPSGLEQVRTGRRIVIHPRYDPAGKRNDIALIELDRPVLLNALSSASPAVGANAVTSGWGLTSLSSGVADVLMRAQLPVIDNATCHARMRQFFPVVDSMICAGVAAGTSGACYYDWGGPLVVRDGAGASQLVGIVSAFSPTCSGATMFTRVSQYASWIARVISGATKICTGQTAPGHTGWQPYGDRGFFKDVDTSACGYTETPRYITSLGGLLDQNVTTGATSIYSPTPTGFRVYVRYFGANPIEPDWANLVHWHINWQALPDGLRPPQALCTGGTPAGATAWQQSGPQTLFVDVNTAACVLAETPSYLTSLGGDGIHWGTLGATSIRMPTPSGFRVQVYNQDGPITPATANALRWHISWHARPRVATADHCSGNTPVLTSPWRQSGGGLVLDVDTTACGLSGVPIYATSLGGTSNGLASSATSLFNPTRTGFQVHVVDSSPITPAIANARQWHINWSVRR